MGYFDTVQLSPRWQGEFTCRQGHPITDFTPPDTAHQWQTKALEWMRDYYDPRVYEITDTGILMFVKPLYGRDQPLVNLVMPYSCSWTDMADIYTSCEVCDKVTGERRPCSVTWFLQFHNGQLVKWISEWDRKAERNNLIGER